MFNEEELFRWSANRTTLTDREFICFVFRNYEDPDDYEWLIRTLEKNIQKTLTDHWFKRVLDIMKEIVSSCPSETSQDVVNEKIDAQISGIEACIPTSGMSQWRNFVEVFFYVASVSDDIVYDGPFTIEEDYQSMLEDYIDADE